MVEKLWYYKFSSFIESNPIAVSSDERLDLKKEKSKITKHLDEISPRNTKFIFMNLFPRPFFYLRLI